MKRAMQTTHSYGQFLRSGRRRRLPRIELLEARFVLSTTIHVDFGLGFATDAAGNLTTTEFEETTVGAIRNVNADVDTGPHLCLLDTSNSCVIPDVDESDVAQLKPLQVDIDGDTDMDVDDITAFAALQDDVIAIMQDVLLPFDVNVQPASASDMAEISTTLAGTQDAYVLVVDGGVIRDVVLEPFDELGLGFGLAAHKDLDAQNDNATAELAITFAKEVFDGTLSTSGLAVTDPVFIDKLTHRLAYTTVHEAFHTFTFEHVDENDGTADGDVIVFGDLNTNPGREHRALVTRSNSWVHDVNNYDKAETILGLRNDNGGLVDFAYVTGTSAHDLISVLAVGDGTAVVDVTPFTDPVPIADDEDSIYATGTESYTISLNAETLLIDPHLGDDQIYLSGDFGDIDIWIRGSGGNDVVSDVVLNYYSLVGPPGNQKWIAVADDDLFITEEDVGANSIRFDGEDLFSLPLVAGTTLLLYGGDDDDILVGGPADDLLDGGSGTDLLTSLGGNNQLFGGPDNDIYDKNSPGIDEIFEFLGGGSDDEVIFDAGIGEILLHLVDTTIGFRAENDAVLKLNTIGNVTLSRETGNALVWLTEFTNGITPIEFINVEGQTMFDANVGAPATVFGSVQANVSINVDGGTVIFAEDQDLADLTVNTTNNAVVEIGTGAQGLSNTVRVYNAVLAIPVPGVQLGNGLLPLRFATLLDRNNVTYIGIREAPVGDANLDGAVDAADERIWAQYFGSDDTDWGQGDFNGDDWTDISDFNLWNNNKTITADLDTLFELIRTGGFNPAYDFDGDGDLDLDDRDTFLGDEGVTLGDINFDGIVDAVDLDVILKNFYLSDQGWAQGDMNGDGAVDNTDFNLWIANRPVAAAAAVLGDLNLDGVVNATDIDVLLIGLQTIADSSLGWVFQVHAASVYDLDEDGYADTDDLDYLIQVILNTEYGDANLDGQVNATDLMIVGAHWESFVASWALGDFNGDGYVDEADLAILNANWGS